MGHNTHDDVARRWRDRALGSARPALRSNNLHDEGDSIFSYGSHFEVARILRDPKGRPKAWLLNGNTYSNTTSKHQGAVRQAIFGHGLDVVTIPHQALDAAGIILDSIDLVEAQRDWNTSTIVTKDSMQGLRWEYDYAPVVDLGGWQNSRTGEIVLRTAAYGESKPRIECDHVIEAPGLWSPGWNWERSSRSRKMRDEHERFHHGIWEEFGNTTRQTGRKRIVSGPRGNTVWDIVDAPESPLGYVFEREVHRHWLGASLIRAAVWQTIQQRHQACNGTGIADQKWYRPAESGIGPLTEEAARRNDDHFLTQQHRFEKQGYWYLDGRVEEELEPFHRWMVETYAEHTECRGCGGRGRVSGQRRRWAYYLSGFDANETRPSYFFCELPPGVSPTTVDEAYETLKPTAVKLAEQMGRDVKRQGDIFAVPMPTLDVRDLKKRGTYARMPKRGTVDPRRGETADVPYLLNTNHAASEVVVIDGQTYARGMMTHVPAWRAPDHKRLKLGQEWHLIVKNTVPIGA